VLVGAASCRQTFGLENAVMLPVDAAPCLATGLTCAGATNAINCGGTCWVSCSDYIDASIAKSRCAQWNASARMAALQSQSDVVCFNKTIDPSLGPWIDLEQAATATTPAAGWSWHGDGFPLTSTNWATNEPDDGNGTESGKEQCAIDDGNGQWHDVSCAQGAPFACVRGGGGGGDT
jgi:hypothetical protein